MEGIIEVDSEMGKELGFTSDKFDGWLWRRGHIITISMIFSLQEKQGNLKKLFDTITEKGFEIIVPTPADRMVLICEKRDMKMIEINFDEGGPADCMVTPKLYEIAKKKHESAALK